MVCIVNTPVAGYFCSIGDNMRNSNDTMTYDHLEAKKTNILYYDI